VDAELRDALAAIPNLPLDDYLPASTSTAMCSGMCSARSATTRSTRNRMTTRRRARFHGFCDRGEAKRRTLCRSEERPGTAGARHRAIHARPHTNEHGYTEINPPLLVRDQVMFGTGQLPKFADDQFSASRTVARTELLHDA